MNPRELRSAGRGGHVTDDGSCDNLLEKCHVTGDAGAAAARGGAACLEARAAHSQADDHAGRLRVTIRW